MSTLNQLLSTLAGVRQTGERQWQARCPTHDDGRASLSICHGYDDRIVLYCHALCPTESVLAAVGLKMSDLFPSRNGQPTRSGTGKIVATYDYRDADGTLLYQSVRFDPKDFRQRRPKDGGGWEWKSQGCKAVPYRLPELMAADPSETVFVAEGEKDVDRLVSLGLVATCNSGGAGKWSSVHAEYLAGRSVVILPDNDEAGRKHAEQAARSLAGKAASIKVVELPDLPDKGDVSNWFDDGGDVDKLMSLVETCGEWRPINQETLPARQMSDNGGEGKKPKSQATMLVELADDVDLFHDLDNEAYARFPVGGNDDLHWEVSRISAKPFRRWLKRRYYLADGKAPSAQSLQDALGVIEAKAIYDGDCRQVFVRVADHQDRIYLDLCNDRWQAIEIDRIGWRIVNDPPVMFRRAKAMLPLATPDPRGDVHLLRRFANVTNEDWPLIVAWLAAAMRPTGPYPVLVIYGEHGSAKSTLARLLRSIVDPNTSPLRADYREPRDLMICANSGWIVALDNLSRIPDWLSDCFCRLSTGGGFSTRTLYENDEETIFDAKRPLILNCIDEVVTRSDLLDRCVLVNLPRIDGDKRIAETQLLRDFDQVRPQILGGLLTAVSAALRDQDSIKLPILPRTADFAIWATAAELALGLRPGEFISSYTASREAGNETAIEASPVGKVLIDFVQDQGEWAGTATDLLKELESRVDDKTKRLKSWPATARTMGGIVKRLAPNLREAGMGVEFNRKGRKGARTIMLTHQPEHTGNPSSASSASSAPQKTPGSGDFPADATADANSAADANAFDPSSAGNSVFPEENGHADATDDADAKIPVRSTVTPEPDWIDV